MINFLIQSTLSLCVLLAAYHLVLEKEKTHQFNRFYLLFSIVFSIIIPFMTIEIINETTNTVTQQNIIKPGEAISTVMENTPNYFQILIWSLYAIVTLILSFRFIRNIQKLQSKINSNTAIKYKNATLVLLKEETLPYTFLNTIFINETDYHNRKIEAELFTHEMIHVTQKHTLDVLFIETLKVLFWFNPLFIFYKKAIQLNHEFLADEKVVKSYNNVPFYQNLLISKANANPTYYLASNLNYSVTKKRLIMMTATTSAPKAMLKKLVLVPLFTGLVFLICVKTVAQEKKTGATTQSPIPMPGMEKYFEKTIFKIKDEKGNLVAEKKFSELSSDEKKNIPPPPPPPVPVPVPVPVNKKEHLKQQEQQKNAVGPEYVELNIHKMSENKALKEQNLNETKPTFPGGMEVFYRFVGANFKIPEEAIKNKINGKVYLSFIVEKDGSLSDFVILRDLGYGVGDEAVRVIKQSPIWIPGTVDGKPARVQYSLPISVVSN